MPLCIISLMTASAGAVCFIIVLSTCSAKECGLQITETIKGRSVVFRNIDITFCQIECFEDFFMVASCHRPNDGSTKKTDGSSVLPLSHPNLSSNACSLKHCQSNTRCVERFHGVAVCVGGHNISSALEKRCARDSDCPEMYVCFTNTCKCEPGYSFNPANNSCVRRCEKYGDGFTTYQGLGIIGHNDGTVQDKRKCSEMCIKEKRFTCITYDIPLAANYCHLSMSGYLDVYMFHRESGLPDWTLGVRNCA